LRELRAATAGEIGSVHGSPGTHARLSAAECSSAAANMHPASDTATMHPASDAATVHPASDSATMHPTSHTATVHAAASGSRGKGRCCNC
jgi:hypothetical protein